MTPALRKVALTAHVITSVAWVGAVVVFLAQAALALTSQDDLMVRGVYVVMEEAAWFALVPLALASLVTGIVMSLGTPWGLLRHYWVVVKLGITAFSTAILLVYMGTFRQMADLAADSTVGLELVRNPSPMLHAILALPLLCGATALGVYKPWGMTPYGRRHQGDVLRSTRATLPWMYVSCVVAICIVVVLVVLHLMGRGLGGH